MVERARLFSRPARKQARGAPADNGSPTGTLSVDEKSQMQALDRSQPAFPMMPGMPEKRTHDYVRHGTTSLFAAMNVEDGTASASPIAVTGRGSSRSSWPRSTRTSLGITARSG